MANLALIDTKRMTVYTLLHLMRSFVICGLLQGVCFMCMPKMVLNMLWVWGCICIVCCVVLRLFVCCCGVFC
jgi:hypothetical protein